MQDAHILSEAKLNKALFLAFSYGISWDGDIVTHFITKEQYGWEIGGGETEGHRFAFDKTELKYSDPEENAVELLRQWNKAKGWFNSEDAKEERASRKFQ